MAESKSNPARGDYKVTFTDRELDNVSADSVEIRQSTVSSVTGGNVTLEQSAGIFVAGEKIVSKNSIAAIVVAQEIHGDMRPIFSLPAALLIAGAIIFGVAMLRKN